MNRMLLAPIVLACGLSTAAPTPQPVRAEIESLLNRLQASGCEFNRNGSWHGGSEARAHLMRKLEYLERHETLKSAEQFIELAASASSSTGTPYQVRCAGTPPVPSAKWLGRELTVIRSPAKP